MYKQLKPYHISFPMYQMSESAARKLIMDTKCHMVNDVATEVLVDSMTYLIYAPLTTADVYQYAEPANLEAVINYIKSYGSTDAFSDVLKVLIKEDNFFDNSRQMLEPLVDIAMEACYWTVDTVFKTLKRALPINHKHAIDLYTKVEAVPDGAGEGSREAPLRWIPVDPRPFKELEELEECIAQVNKRHELVVKKLLGKRKSSSAESGYDVSLPSKRTRRGRVQEEAQQQQEEDEEDEGENLEVVDTNMEELADSDPKLLGAGPREDEDSASEIRDYRLFFKKPRICWKPWMHMPLLNI